MPILEICVDTPAGVAAAVAGGADRVELCAALSLGGLTPSAGLVDIAVKAAVPVVAMIRPHEGGFRYDEATLCIMVNEIVLMAAAGVEGVVFGATDGAGGLDRAVLARLMQTVRTSEARRGIPLRTTLHRAIDLCADPLAALDHAIALGFDRVLSAGGATSARAGSACLAAMRRRAADRCEIVAGAGVDAANVRALIDATGVGAVHASCRADAVARDAEDDRAVTLGFGATARQTSLADVRALRLALDASFHDQ
jgi:copper homeostasis protein